MVDKLSQELEQGAKPNSMMMEHGSISSLQELLGTDIDTPLINSQMQTVYSTDTTVISRGGLSTGSTGGDTILIKPNCNQSIIDLNSIVMFAQLEVGANVDAPINALALFRPVRIKLGGWSGTFPYGEYCAQQMLEIMPHALVEPHSEGIMYHKPHDDHDVFLSATAATPLINSNEYDLTAPNVLPDVYSQYVEQVLNRSIACNAAKSNRVIAIPMHLMFYPTVKSIGPLAYVNAQGDLEFELLTKPAGFGMHKVLTAANATYTAAVGATYTLRNYGIFYRYMPLGNGKETLLASLKKNELAIRPESFTSHQVNLSGTTTLTIGIDAKKKMKALVFAVHQDGGIANALVQSQATLYAGANIYSGGATLFPQFYINRLQISGLSEQLSLDMQQLAMLQYTGGDDVINYPYPSGRYGGEIWKTLRSPYVVDLTRFGVSDAIGSTKGQGGNIVVTLTFDFNRDMSLFGRGNLTTAAPYQGIAVQPDFSKHRIYAFVLYSELVVLKEG